MKFQKEDLDALFTALKDEWGTLPDFEELVRDAHLAIALSDSDRSLPDEVDPRVATLVEKHRPRG